MLLQEDGNVGIGTTNPLVDFVVAGSAAIGTVGASTSRFTVGSSSSQPIGVEVTKTSGTGGIDHKGAYFSCTGSMSNWKDKFGIDVLAHTSNWSHDEIFGVNVLAEKSESGTNNVYGVKSIARCSSTASNGGTKTFYGLYGKVEETGSETITTGYSVYADSPTGSVTNAYGFYQNGGGKNYFASALGLGADPGSFKLNVSGTSQLNGLVTVNQIGIKIYNGWGGVSTTLGGGSLFMGFNVKGAADGNKIEASNTHASGAGWAYMRCTGYSNGISFHTKAGNTTAGEDAVTNERMRIGGDGNVGIGGIDPGFLLDVQQSGLGWVSQIYNTGTGGNYAGLLVKTADTTATTKAFGVYSGSAYSLVVMNDGKVGIGITAPEAKLHVKGSEGLVLQSSSGGGDERWMFDSNGYQGYLGIGFSATSTPGTPKLVIKEDGNIGMGTPSPSERLDIEWTDGANYSSSSVTEGVNIKLSNVQSNTNGVAGLIFGARSTTTSYAKVGAEVTGNGNIDLFFQTEGSGTIGERMRIKADGKVGIGAADPGSYKFVVSETSNGGGVYPIRAVNTGTAVGTSAAISFGYGAAAGGAALGIITAKLTNVNQSSSLAFQTLNAGSWNTGITMLADGNVGIGITNPGNYKLYVDGAFRSSGNATVSGGTLYIGSDCNIFRASANKMRTNDAFYFGAAIHDVNDSAGTSGQVLSSTGSGVDWVNAQVEVVRLLL